MSTSYNDLHDHEIVAQELEHNKPRYILVTPEMETAYLDPKSPVAKVIRKNYQRVGIVGNAVVYRLKR